MSAIYPLVGVGSAMPRLRGCNYGCIVITAVITVITDPCFPITCNWQTIACTRSEKGETATVRKTMSSPPLRGTAEWSATREVALLLGLTGGNRYAAQQLWLRKERIKAEASQVASAGPPQASQQPAGYRAKPAPAQAQAVPKQRTPAQLARNERSRERLFQKHLAKVAKVHPMLQAWLRRARASLGQPMELQPVPPATPTRPSVAVPESGAGQPPFQAEVVNLPCLAGTQSDLPNARLLSITAMAAYQDKSFEELRWEHYSKGNVLEARPPAEPPAAAQPAPPSQQPSTALVAAARASLDASGAAGRQRREAQGIRTEFKMDRG